MKRWKIELIALATLAMAWLACLLAANPLAHCVEAHLGNAVRHATHDLITDVRVFTLGRLYEGAWLLTAAVVLLYLQVLVARLLRRLGTSPTWAWTVNSGVLFISINLFLAAASHTALFWCSMFQGFEGGAENYGPFHVKYHLIKESRQTPRAVIMGNSQANRQFQPQLLNNLLASRLETADLHWPGSQGYDILLVHRRTQPINAQIVICYVSEGTFYSGASGESVPLFFQVSDLQDCWNLPLLSHVSSRKVAYGLLSDLLPAYALRDTLAQRILGKGLVGIKQRQIDERLGVALENTARTAASIMKMDNQSDFQKKAFAMFVEGCVQRNQKLVIVAGQLNPVLGTLLPPEMRVDMLGYLRSLGSRHPGMVFVDEPPFQPAEHYLDLTHVRPEQRKEFTCYMARRLEELKLVAAVPVRREDPVALGVARRN